MTPAGWHPDPSGVPGRLRWWDGQTWTEHVHDPAPAAAPAAGSPLDAVVLVVGAPREVGPGCRVFELTDGAGGRLGRLVETSRGVNESALGAALSRAKGWQHATTREVRGSRGYPEVILAWGPVAPGAIVVTLPDRREVGRLVLGEAGWAVLAADGRHLGSATSAGVTATDGSRLADVAPEGVGGWRVVKPGTPVAEPLRALLTAAAVAADLLATG